MLCNSFISSVETAYGTRLAALQLLTSLISSVRQTWTADTAKHKPGSIWDDTVIKCQASVVRHICMPNHDTRLGGTRGKQILRQALQCLHELVTALPVAMWSEAWQQVSLDAVLLPQSLPSCHEGLYFIPEHQPDPTASQQAWWLNGRASDSRSEGCVFDSRPGHELLLQGLSPDLVLFLDSSHGMLVCWN